MHSMWKGAISFGLVMIPVKLYAATEQKDIAFRQVHREDGGRIRFRRVCSIDGQEVPYEDVAKGYELPTGEMIVLTDEDMADLPLPTTRNIEVLHFMPAEQLDPIMLNRSYLIEPEAAGTRAYVLLRDALADSGKIALARVALRQRESLASLRARDGQLILETLLWPDEVREIAFPFQQEEVDVRPQELSMASSLIDSMTADFDPGAYHDGYREALQELVTAKAEGREVMQPAEEAAAPEPASLADALRASLAAVRGGPEGGERRAGGGAGSKSGRGGAGKPAPGREPVTEPGREPAKRGAGKARSAKPAAARERAERAEPARARPRRRAS